ncbi:MAG TPA: molybdopterin-guanine dinucleotide biosynthesis protein B [Thermoanaerobaculia bacterium]|nr:molybdopterin-guanine dinucleotide biosynthesis protein B [Thermoanaerobaculia bacterium]
MNPFPPPPPRPVAFIGYSGSGKTTLLVRLVARFAEQGRDIGVIKHTHHPLPSPSGGDTERYLAAGAAAVILAGRERAMIHRAGSLEPELFGWFEPRELLDRVGTSQILIEGFKELRAWPRILVRRTGMEAADLDLPDLIAVVSDEERLETALPRFGFEQIDEIAAFVDRISRP